MTTWKILYEHLGENATTAHDPVAVYVEGAVNLREKVVRCAAADWDMLVDVARWRVGNVTLPDWLPPEEWIRNVVAWKYLWGMGAPRDWPESWQRGLLHLPEAERYACIKLLSTQFFRALLRASLRMQLVAWCEDRQRARITENLPLPARVPAWRSPFSKKQWSCLIDGRTARDARNISERLYWTRSALAA